MGFAAPRPLQGRAGAEAIGRGERSDGFATPDRRCQPLQLALDRRRQAAELPGLQVPGNGVDEQLAARTLERGLADDLCPGVKQLSPRHPRQIVKCHAVDDPAAGKGSVHGGRDGQAAGRGGARSLPATLHSASRLLNGRRPSARSGLGWIAPLQPPSTCSSVRSGRSR
jgi:hypothetical protein